MKVLGLFVVMFGCLLINKAIGLSEEASIVGTIIGAGTYILAMLRP